MAPTLGSIHEDRRPPMQQAYFTLGNPDSPKTNEVGKYFNTRTTGIQPRL